MGAKLLVDLVYVEWGSRNRATSLREALRCIATAGAELGNLVVADNKLDCTPLGSVPAHRAMVIPGDNYAREFSGWDLAYKAIRYESDAGAILFVNDTFSAHRRARLLRRIRVARWLQTVAKSPTAEMFGPLDPFSTEPESWAFGALRQYVSSYLFGMNPQAAELLFPLCQVDAQLDGFLADEFTPAGLFKPSLPQAYQDRINDWLLTPGNWRNAAPVTVENFPFFRLKAKSVLYEYALTSRAITAGISVSDLFSGRSWLDQRVGNAAKWWIENVTLSRYPWLQVLDVGRSLRHSEKS